MITIRDNSALSSKEDTVYSFLNIPEKDEEIVEHAKKLRDAIQKGRFGNMSNFLLEKFSGTYIREITDAITLYEQTGDISKFFSRYCLADLGIRKALLKEIEHSGKKSNKEINDKFREYQDAWAIVSNPQSRKDYDTELAEMRRIQAIQDEKIRMKVIRKKLVREELSKTLDIELFDRSHLGGDKMPRFGIDGTSQFGWEVSLYDKKRKIFDVDVDYDKHPELGEKVEVYSHGQFRWTGNYRRDRNGFEYPSLTNDLCELISVVRTDINGDSLVSYVIAQTRDLGYIADLTDAEILDLEANGISVYNLVTEEEEKRLEIERRRLQREEARRRRNQPEDRRTKINRYLNKIGLELPEEEKPKKIELPAQKLAEYRKPYNPDEKHHVLVMQPRRYEIPEEDKADFARLFLSEHMIQLAYEKNGSFIGTFDLSKPEELYRRNDDTIQACQYASKYPGLVISRYLGKKGYRFNSLHDVYNYIIEQENTQRRKTSVEIVSEIEFFGE